MNNTGIQSNQVFSLLLILDLNAPDIYRRPLEYNHDASVCIIEEGKVKYANAEERFSFKKHDGSSIKDIVLDIRRNFDPDLIRYLDSWEKSILHCDRDHHTMHIYEVFYNSGFDEAAVFVNDGCGTSNDCITLAYMERGKEPKIFKKFSDKNSLGNLYAIMAGCIFGGRTKEASFTEGKLMGLASYGKPIDDLVLVDIINGELTWNLEALKKIGISFIKEGNVFSIYQDESEIFIGDLPILIQANYAATLQRDFENCSIKAIKMLKNFLDKNGITTKNLCLSGGCILNCPTNSKIVDLNLFEHYYASPNPADGGICLGEVYEKLIQEDNNNAFQYQRLNSSYLGYNYSYDEILEDLKHSAYYDKYRDQFVELDSSAFPILYNYLLDQKILCWYQGGAEFGPRALGHRSLLADPRTFKMNQKLNHIKGREPWRPLAPIVPEELFEDVFEVQNTDLCEFMLRTLKIKDNWIPMLKGVCHTDNTARPQLLKKEVNPELYSFLMFWYKKTGCPALINTSLNLAGLPIVERASQVLDLMYLAKSSELIGVFVGSPLEILTVTNSNLNSESPKKLGELNL